MPKKFKQADMLCYRKRFLLEGEIVPIALEGNLAEGIASWTTSLKYAMDFKDLYKENTKFAVVFKHIPEEAEVIVNIARLWKNKTFIKAAEKFRKEHPDKSVALFNFRDKQSEVVLRSTLKGNEIEDIVGISHSFDELCDMADIPEDQRENISKWYAKNPNAIPIEERVFAGSKATKQAVAVAIAKMKAIIEDAKLNNIPLIWPKDLVHINDLKHMPK